MTEQKPSPPCPSSLNRLPRATQSLAAESIETSQTQASPSVPSVDTPPPKEFGRYRILKELGNGAMGVVYLAEDTQLDRQVALKIPRASTFEDEESRERF